MQGTHFDSLQWLCCLGGDQVSMIRVVLFCFFKNLTSVDLSERLDRFLVLDILKTINYGVYVSSLMFFPSIFIFNPPEFYPFRFLHLDMASGF